MVINSLGIEIRRTNGIKDLYEQVDNHLNEVEKKFKENGENIVKTAVAHALQKMISVDSYFDITEIINCAKVASIVISAERMNIYRLAHCMHWNQMTPEYRQTLVAMVLDDFRVLLNK